MGGERKSLLSFYGDLFLDDSKRKGWQLGPPLNDGQLGDDL